MGEPESADQNYLLQGSRRVPPRYYSYDFLVWQSRRLGRAATNSFFRLREFFKQDISAPQWLHGGWHQAKPGAEANKSTHGSVENLQERVKKSQEVLAQVKTVFPLTLFPDTIVLDRTKLTLTQQNFFWSQNVMSIGVEDILNVSTNVGPFFGSLKISIRVMNSTDHFDINYFWRKDAIFLKRIIQGYLIALHSKLDIADLSKDELVTMLCDLGNDTHK